jgi:hypothetical protein
VSGRGITGGGSEYAAILAARGRPGSVCVECLIGKQKKPILVTVLYSESVTVLYGIKLGSVDCLFLRSPSRVPYRTELFPRAPNGDVPGPPTLGDRGFKVKENWFLLFSKLNTQHTH